MGAKPGQDHKEGGCNRRKAKAKVALEQATKAQRGSRGIALLFL